MIQLVIASVAISVAALAAGAVSMFGLSRARAQARAAADQAQAGEELCGSALRALRESLDGLAAQLKVLQQQPSVAVAPATPKPGLNLTKRSLALRMHRRGDPAEQIAAALEIPVQEVDLLLKVHRIVIRDL